MNRAKVYINDLSLCSALGTGVWETVKRLETLHHADDSPLIKTDRYTLGTTSPMGLCGDHFPDLPPGCERFDCRNNRVLWYLFTQIQQTLTGLADEYDWERVGLVLGTSTSGIDQSEAATAVRLDQGVLPANWHFVQQQLSGGTDFLLQATPLAGPTYTISTACSSSSHALASAKRLIETDLCDVVVAGGVDTLCQFTTKGFAALEVVSPELTNPLSSNRRGINLGEGGALFVLSRQRACIQLLGTGASADAYHISAPHPEGRGAEAAIRAALADASIQAKAVDYINLHGTGTKQNDAAEARAVKNVFGSNMLCSSTKPMTGHLLGAAGAIEAALMTLMLMPRYNPHGRVLPHLYDGQYDPDIEAIELATHDDKTDANREFAIGLSNSFAFGGNNAVILVGVVKD